MYRNAKIKNGMQWPGSKTRKMAWSLMVKGLDSPNLDWWQYKGGLEIWWEEDGKI